MANEYEQLEFDLGDPEVLVTPEGKTFFKHYDEELGRFVYVEEQYYVDTVASGR